jgi:outer membrane protein TolC
MPRLTLPGLLALVSLASAQQPLTLTLQDALERARTNSQQLLSADIAARIAHEDRVQAKAALLPTLNWENGFTYTQPNGTDTGVFVANNGPRVYSNMASVHADVYSPARRADYQIAIAGEAIARARVEIAQRGLTATVVQNYYGMVAAQRHFAHAQRGRQEAEQFLDITRKQEAGGEAARADVVKAQIELNNRERDLREAQLAIDKARIGFAVYLFPDFRQDFAVVDDLDQAAILPPFPELEGLAQKNNPEIRAAQANITQGNYGIKSARAGFLPTLSLDYFYGLQANQYAVHGPNGENNLGSSVVAGLTVPVWNWGAVRSRVRQAELRLQQSKVDLSFAQRQLLANLNSFYLEAATASAQLAALKQSLDLAEDSLRLTVLRYQAGEATVLEVVDAQRTVLDARNSWDDGKARYRVALSALQTLTGAF